MIEIGPVPFEPVLFEPEVGAAVVVVVVVPDVVVVELVPVVLFVAFTVEGVVAAVVGAVAAGAAPVVGVDAGGSLEPPALGASAVDDGSDVPEVGRGVVGLWSVALGAGAAAVGSGGAAAPAAGDPPAVVFAVDAAAFVVAAGAKVEARVPDACRVVDAVGLTVGRCFIPWSAPALSGAAAVTAAWSDGASAALGVTAVRMCAFGFGVGATWWTTGVCIAVASAITWTSEWRTGGAVATTEVAATVSAVAAILVAPPTKRLLSTARREPLSFERGRPRLRCCGSASRPCARERRARKSSVSTADCESPIWFAISA
jgi:hypothetical protein